MLISPWREVRRRLLEAWWGTSECSRISAACGGCRCLLRQKEVRWARCCGMLSHAQPCLARLSHAAPSKPTLSRSQHWQVVTLSAGTPHKLGTPKSTGARHHWVSWYPMVSHGIPWSSIVFAKPIPSTYGARPMPLDPHSGYQVYEAEAGRLIHATWHATGPQKRPLMPGQCPMACPWAQSSCWGEDIKSDKKHVKSDSSNMF